MRVRVGKYVIAKRTEACRPVFRSGTIMTAVKLLRKIILLGIASVPVLGFCTQNPLRIPRIVQK